MYSTCLFCHRSLGANQVVESFPVGRRLAFDAERGRLWVVCPHCARWNLSALEERWEAMETCEREFRGSALQVSTANVGMARLREGLELVRVGQPERAELAAWRYGRQFGRRWRKQIAIGGAITAVSAASLVPVVGMTLGMRDPGRGDGGSGVGLL